MPDLANRDFSRFMIGRCVSLTTPRHRAVPLVPETRGVEGWVGAGGSGKKNRYGTICKKKSNCGQGMADRWGYGVGVGVGDGGT